MVLFSQHKALASVCRMAVLALAGLMITTGASAATLQEADHAYRRTDFRASLALLDRMAPEPAVNHLIGRNYLALGDAKRASEYLQKAFNAEPSNSLYALWLGRAYGRRAETANPLSAAGLAGKTRTYFEKAVELNPHNLEALSDLFDYYLEAPKFMGGGTDKAAAIASRIAAIDPAEGSFAQARLAEKRKEFSTAEQELRRAAQLAPHQVGRLLDLAKFLSKQGRTRESDAVLARAEQVAPQSPRVWYAKADMLIGQKRNLEEAQQLLQKYLRAPITVDDPPKVAAERLLKQARGA